MAGPGPGRWHGSGRILAAFAEPGGPTVRQVYEDFRAEILADLAGAGAVDMVLLNLHGAMVADGYDDCEGDLTAAIRAAVGEDVVIGVELDLHCSLTRKLVAAADVIVTFKEYPHVDVVERAAEVYDLALATQRGEIRPVMAVHDCRMVHLWRTPFEPMRGFVDAMSAAEGHDGILSVSFAHGFPWGNVPETTARMLVVADGDGDKARATAADFAGRLWAMREETRDPSSPSTPPWTARWRRPRPAPGRWFWPTPRTTPAAARHRTRPSSWRPCWNEASPMWSAAFIGTRFRCGFAARPARARC